jgi:hypothetical protein
MRKIPTPTIMVCSRCAAVIARISPPREFDLVDCSWHCPGCGTLWLTDDGWETVNTVLLPWRASDKGLPYAWESDDETP